MSDYIFRGYHIRMLNEQAQPASCTWHPGPVEDAKRFARRRAREDGYARAEVCTVIPVAGGSGTGSRVALVEATTPFDLPPGARITIGEPADGFVSVPAEDLKAPGSCLACDLGVPRRPAR